MKPKQSKERKVKAFAAINTYDGRLINYGIRGKVYTPAVFYDKGMIDKVDNRSEQVKYRIVPCFITYTLPVTKKSK